MKMNVKMNVKINSLRPIGAYVSYPPPCPSFDLNFLDVLRILSAKADSHLQDNIFSIMRCRCKMLRVPQFSTQLEFEQEKIERHCWVLSGGIMCSRFISLIFCQYCLLLCNIKL
jgi:hypothetical protein